MDRPMVFEGTCEEDDRVFGRSGGGSSASTRGNSIADLVKYPAHTSVSPITEKNAVFWRFLLKKKRRRKWRRRGRRERKHCFSSSSPSRASTPRDGREIYHDDDAPSVRMCAYIRLCSRRMDNRIRSRRALRCAPRCTRASSIGDGDDGEGRESMNRGALVVVVGCRGLMHLFVGGIASVLLPSAFRRGLSSSSSGRSSFICSLSSGARALSRFQKRFYDLHPTRPRERERRYTRPCDAAEYIPVFPLSAFFSSFGSDEWMKEDEMCVTSRPPISSLLIRRALLLRYCGTLSLYSQNVNVFFRSVIRPCKHEKYKNYNFDNFDRGYTPLQRISDGAEIVFRNDRRIFPRETICRAKPRSCQRQRAKYPPNKARFPSRVQLVILTPRPLFASERARMPVGMEFTMRVRNIVRRYTHTWRATRWDRIASRRGRRRGRGTGLCYIDNAE